MVNFFYFTCYFDIYVFNTICVFHFVKTSTRANTFLFTETRKLTNDIIYARIYHYSFIAARQGRPIKGQCVVKFFTAHKNAGAKSFASKKARQFIRGRGWASLIDVINQLVRRDRINWRTPPNPYPPLIPLSYVLLKKIRACKKHGLRVKIGQNSEPLQFFWVETK